MYFLHHGLAREHLILKISKADELSSFGILGPNCWAVNVAKF